MVFCHHHFLSIYGTGLGSHPPQDTFGGDDGPVSADCVVFSRYCRVCFGEIDNGTSDAVTGAEDLYATDTS